MLRENNLQHAVFLLIEYNDVIQNIINSKMLVK